MRCASMPPMTARPGCWRGARRSRIWRRKRARNGCSSNNKPRRWHASMPSCAPRKMSRRVLSSGRNRRVRRCTGQIDTEMQEVRSHERELQSQREDLDARFQEFDQTLAVRQQALEAARTGYEEADARQRSARDEQQRLAAERQRIEYELAG